LYFEDGREVSFHDALVLFNPLQGCQANASSKGKLAFPADSLYQHLLLTAEKKFWRCVESGEPPRLFLAEPPRVRVEAVRIVDMSSSNSWADFASAFRLTHAAFLEHENAKGELKRLMPDDAKEAIGHGIQTRRARSGAVTFEITDEEAHRASIQ
jgi:hypothetical protein